MKENVKLKEEQRTYDLQDKSETWIDEAQTINSEEMRGRDDRNKKT